MRAFNYAVGCSKVILLMLVATAALLPFPVAADEPDASDSITYTTETEELADAGEGFTPISELAQDEMLVNGVFVMVAIVFGSFLVIFYRMTLTKKIVSVQNKKLSMQQHALEKAQQELRLALKKEKSFREKLQSTHENLKSAQSQLIHAEKMSSLGQLTAGIAHEINNPVGFIKGGVQTLKIVVDDLFTVIDSYEGVKLDDNLRENMERCREESRELLDDSKQMIAQLFRDTLFGTERVVEIVHGLRVFSRHDEAKIKCSSVEENLESALMILKHKTKDRAEIIKQFDPNVGEIDCFPGQLNQVFINLISNAVDAFDDCGSLIISTHDLGNKVQLSFKDNGCGIPEDVVGKIFDPFFTTKDVGEGTGLGLSISHSIIEQHKGKIEVFSKVGVGTEFRITLPKNLDIKEAEAGAKGAGTVMGSRAESIKPLATSA